MTDVNANNTYLDAYKVTMLLHNNESFNGTSKQWEIFKNIDK